MGSTAREHIAQPIAHTIYENLRFVKGPQPDSRGRIVALRYLVTRQGDFATLKSAPRDKLGIAAGALATSRTVGQSTSVALAGAIFANAGGTAAGHLLLKAPAVPPATMSLAQQLFLT